VMRELNSDPTIRLVCEECTSLGHKPQPQ
jgi:hypothetical protein